MYEQGTPEWRADRVGHITASRFSDVLTEPRSKADKEAGRLSQTAQSYLFELLGEILTGRPADEIDTPAMRWGRENEPSARAAYEIDTTRAVTTVGFLEHPSIRYVGCSPDGLVGDDGLVEIKCPWTTREHVRTLVTREIPDQYVVQVQGQLWVTGRAWCDFTSFDPRVIYHGADLVIVRVGRDDEFIDGISSACERLWKALTEAITTIRKG